MLIWITGISGTGKSTIGSALYTRIKPRLPNLFYLDGDEFRSAMGGDLGYSLEDRDRNAVRIIGACKLLCAQDIHVICAANLTSQRFREQCRKEIKNYYEVYLEVPISKLRDRDKKDIYRKAFSESNAQVVGVQIPFSRPETMDLIVDNSADRTDFGDVLDQIIVGSGLDKLLSQCPKSQI